MGMVEPEALPELQEAGDMAEAEEVATAARQQEVLEAAMEVVVPAALTEGALEVTVVLLEVVMQEVQAAA